MTLATSVVPDTLKFCEGEGLGCTAVKPVSEATEGVITGAGTDTVPLTFTVDVVAPVAVICTVALFVPSGAVALCLT